jgi:hypothetical protein
VPTYTVLAAGVLLGLASIALNSPAWQPWAAWLFAGQVAFAHLFLSTLITVRTTMWKLNYPRAYRARIAGRVQMIRQLLTMLTVAGLSLLFDRDPGWYRLVYPAIAVLGLLSLVPLRRIRIRGETAERRRFRGYLAKRAAGARIPSCTQTRENPCPPGDGGPCPPYSPHPDPLPGGGAEGTIRNGLWPGLREAAAVLRDDRPFARYMLAQFLLGSANFFTDPVLVNILARRLEFNYFGATLLLQIIPAAALLISIRYWARLFDFRGILRFRVYNSAWWAGSYLFVTLAMLAIALFARAALLPAVALLVIARVMNGVSRGGGDIAWNIGHLHFARDHQTEIYMGIHVALTGVRGIIMLFLGWLANQYLGWASFLIALALALTAMFMFRRMAFVDRSAAALVAVDAGSENGVPLGGP